MSVLPANISRATTALRVSNSISGLQGINRSLFELQSQMSTGKLINRPSDDPVRASTISMLELRLAAGTQRNRNLSHADQVLSTLDASMTDVTDVIGQARSIASENIGITSDSTARSTAAISVDSLIQRMLATANRDASGIYVFGGSTATSPPVTSFMGGFRYTARGSGMTTDLGAGEVVPVTVGSGNGVGDASAALPSTRDLNPALSGTTRLSDLRGARGLGVSLGTVAFVYNGGATGTVDLTGAQSVQDVMNRVTTAIRQYETANGVTVLNPAGVTAVGGALNFDVASTGSLIFADVGGGTTAADLGLSQQAFSSATTTAGVDLDPKLTMGSAVSGLSGLTLPLGSIRLKMIQGAAVVQRDIDLSGVSTIDDIRSAIESSGIGVRVQIASDGRGLSIQNEVSGMRLSIEEVPGGADTATELGIRTMSNLTPGSRLNNGAGVRIATGGTDPVTGNPDPSRDTDFRITLGNGQAFDVDLRPQDLTNVQSIIARINQQFNAAIALPPINTSAPVLAAGQFNASLSNGPNGLVFQQAIGAGAPPIRIEKLNNSAAAEDLGLLSATFDSATSTLQAQDRGTVRVNNIFSDLIDLREALRGNDTAGIGVAGERLTSTNDLVSASHAVIGTYAQRVEEAKILLADRTTMDTKAKSDLQDIDFADAATRLSLLQTQLQASLQVTGQIGSKNLFDFLSF